MSFARNLVPRLLVALLGLAVLAAAAALVALLTIRHIPQQELAPGLYVLEGRGGNTTVFAAADGVMVVDTKFWRFAERLRKVVDALSTQPITYVVNTSYSWELTHGNPEFPPQATFVSTVGTLEHMLKLDAAFWAAPKAKATLPRETFEEKDHRIRIGDELVHVVQVGRGHTDGDCVVYFPAQGVVAAGDLFFNGYYPVVDHAAGGSLIDWIETIEHVLALGPRKIVPGHGPVTEPADLKAFQGFLRDLLVEVSRMRAAGKTREQVMKTLHLPVHEARMKNLYEYSSLAQIAGDAFDELAAGGKLPESITSGEESAGVEAADGEPDEAGEGDKATTGDPNAAGSGSAGPDAASGSSAEGAKSGSSESASAPTSPATGANATDGSSTASGDAGNKPASSSRSSAADPKKP